MGMMPADRVRRNPCAQSAEAGPEFAASAMAAVDLGVGMLFLLDDKLGGEAAPLECIGGAVIVRPGSTRCLNIGISDARA